MTDAGWVDVASLEDSAKGLKILFKAEKEITKEEAKIQSAQMEIRNLPQEAQRRLRQQTTLPLPWLDLLFRSVTRR